MKIQKKIASEIKFLHGSVLGIGIENEKLVDATLKNKNITRCDLLGNLQNEENGTGNINGKTISIYKLRKKYKKEEMDFIICNIDDVKNFLKHFLRDGFYIYKNTLYLFGYKKHIELDELKERLQRYKLDIDFYEDKEEYLLVIKKKPLSSVFLYYYFITDLITEELDRIGTLLNQ